MYYVSRILFNMLFATIVTVFCLSMYFIIIERNKLLQEFWKNQWPLGNQSPYILYYKLPKHTLLLQLTCLDLNANQCVWSRNKYFFFYSFMYHLCTYIHTYIYKHMLLLHFVNFILFLLYCMRYILLWVYCFVFNFYSRI